MATVTKKEVYEEIVGLNKKIEKANKEIDNYKEEEEVYHYINVEIGQASTDEDMLAKELIKKFIIERRNNMIKRWQNEIKILEKELKKYL